MRHRLSIVTSIVVTIVLVVAVASPVSAAPSGTLDPTFGVGGIVVANLSDFVAQCVISYPTSSCGPEGERVEGLVVQPDGHVVVATDWSADGGVTVWALLVRFDVTGRRDLSFGSGGSVLVGPRTSGALDVKSDRAGHLYVYRDNRWISRYDATGHLDTGWGTAGRLLTMGGDSWIVAGDGTIFESFVRPYSQPRVVIREYARYGPTGVLDRTWGVNGVAFLVAPQATVGGYTFSGFEGMDATAAGGLVVVGRAYRYQGLVEQDRVVLGHLDAHGRPDPAFGPGGIAVPVGPSQLPDLFGFSSYLVEAVPDGRTVIGGRRTAFGTGSAINIVRTLPNGSGDPSFGVGGLAVIDLTADGEALGGTEYASWFAVDASGRTVVAASIEIPGVGDRMALARLTPSGALDPTFGIAGRAFLPIDTTQPYLPHFTLSPDGGVAVGSGVSTPNRPCDTGGSGVGPCSDLLLEKVRGG